MSQSNYVRIVIIGNRMLLDANVSESFEKCISSFFFNLRRVLSDRVFRVAFLKLELRVKQHNIHIWVSEEDI